MKTQVLHIEPHDDVISIGDKMGWGQTGRILLVWPDVDPARKTADSTANGPYLERRLDLVLLQRRAVELGAQLALVTHDPLIQAEAQDLGISLFESARKAQNARWRSPRRRKFRPRPGPRRDLLAWREQIHPKSPRWLEHPITRFALALLAVGGLLAIAAAFVPSAEIRLTPATTTQEIVIPIAANPLAESFTLSGEVPARRVTVIVEGQDVLTATGEIPVPAGQAVGTVVFTNLTELAVTVPTGTIVTTGGETPIRFAVAVGGEVPAGAGRSAPLPVRAVLPGTQGNLPANSLQAVEGALSFSLAAVNPRPMNSGAEVRVAAPSDADRLRLYNQLVASLRQKALQQFQAGLAADDVLLTASPVLTDTIEKLYAPDATQASEQISLTLRLEFEARMVSGNDLRLLAAALLDASLPVGYTAQPNTLALEMLTQPKTGRSGVQWRLRAQRTLVAQVVASEAVAVCVGLPPPEALRQLTERLPLAAAPKIRLDPPWWPRLPLAPFRITIVSEKP